ncbi:hypothetical protein [Rivularia sp. UHCC 0363]|uniref:hypothetical protein n=1 Tax=Rivularia sp. UHCC 0363 TaxID=3110244 RepID=UPI002B220E30|nr:hypothetical protein [Rivularia sp. UHCC 0363]MEA5595667.1 hypothetical protein [Rivularia sp. UHCC 0363]
MYKSIETHWTMVGNLPIPKPYRQHMFMGEWFDAEPIGIDPLTLEKIYFGDGFELACTLKDKPDLEFDIPF